MNAAFANDGARDRVLEVLEWSFKALGNSHSHQLPFFALVKGLGPGTIGNDLAGR